MGRAKGIIKKKRNIRKKVEGLSKLETTDDGIGELKLLLESNWWQYYIKLVNQLYDRRYEYLRHCPKEELQTIQGELTGIEATIQLPSLLIESHVLVHSQPQEGE